MKENLAERDTAIVTFCAIGELGAMVIDNSNLTPTQTADLIINEVKRKSKTVEKVESL